jgi:uncharacterized OsmC-like protein
VSAVPEGITSADVIVWGEGSAFAQQIAVGPHQLRSDEPESVGGSDTGPSPYDFLLAALGSCTSMTVAMYARKKNWPLQRSRFGFDIRRYTLQTARNVKREKACSTESSGTCD